MRWIDEPAPGAEADHPAPTLKLAKSATAGGAGTTTSTAAQDAAATMNSGKNDTDGTAVGLGVAGLVLGLAGLVAGALAYRRAGRTA
ncbi:hypothetical protein [Dactylosporangium sp. NPDC048998]|uniref:hypothetical protein n=1 Tax=Dactylosporangium sp. NPDC048998 TaxID=3363976 RepID=UPI00371EBC70